MAEETNNPAALAPLLDITLNVANVNSGLIRLSIIGNSGGVSTGRYMDFTPAQAVDVAKMLVQASTINPQPAEAK